MGLCFSKQTARETIIELEQQIEEKEKEIKRIKKNKETAGDRLIKGIAGLSIAAMGFLWVCKESFSFSFLLKVLLVFLGIGAGGSAIYFGKMRMDDFWMRRKVRVLSRLKERQRQSIESLKKETKYEETHEIIRRYNRSKEAEGEREKATRDENIVDKIVRLL